MTMPGGAELIIILFIVLLLFGAKKLPDLAGSMGKSMREFRKASKEALEEDEAEEARARSERDAET
jgi:sec-independent protein translocase protein TatA